MTIAPVRSSRYSRTVRRASRFLLLFILASAVFVLFINGPDIVASHEGRVAQPARQMAASGWPWSAKPADVGARCPATGECEARTDWSAEPIHVNPWLVPVLNGQIRLQKPPLPYWCEAVFFRLLGFSEFRHEWSPR